jgi:hypothetical protein
VLPLGIWQKQSSAEVPGSLTDESIKSSRNLAIGATAEDA